MISAPCGIDTWVPTAAILPSWITTVPLLITPLVIVSIEALVSAKVPYLPLGLWAMAAPAKSSAARRYMFFLMWGRSVLAKQFFKRKGGIIQTVVMAALILVD